MSVMTLNEIPIGKSGIITSVGGKNELRLRLLDMGLVPKTKATIQKIAPMGDPIEIMIRGYELTIRIADAEMIEVEEAEDSAYDICSCGKSK